MLIGNSKCAGIFSPNIQNNAPMSWIPPGSPSLSFASLTMISPASLRMLWSILAWIPGGTSWSGRYTPLYLRILQVPLSMMLRVRMSFGFGSACCWSNKAYRSSSAFSFFFARSFYFCSLFFSFKASFFSQLITSRFSWYLERQLAFSYTLLQESCLYFRL